jgi:steroid 5-alpha reductase family enzyme
MNPFVVGGMVVLAWMHLWFFIALYLKRNDVADIAWGLGFVLLAWTSTITGYASFPSIVVNILVTIWGVRLASHIYQRNSKKPEDSRYQEWRRQWRYFYLRSYLQVFLLQGILLYIIGLPILALHASGMGRFDLWSMLGIGVWILGFVFESVADAQLAAFVRNPTNKGKILQSGLWRYSRHPNYFGEVTQWWGIWVIVVAATGLSWTIVGPLTISWLILFVSGIPLLEKKYQNRADFKEYKARTSIFIPLPPRNI